MDAEPTEGLRARKKRQTRLAIAAAAARLFAERGYEAVTIIDVAQAADVAAPTVYNHFPTKEHLVFDNDDEMPRQLIAHVSDRPSGTSVVAAVRDGALAFLAHLATNPPADPRGGMPYLVATSPNLHRWMLEVTAGWADRLAVTIETRKDTSPSAAARVTARALISLYQIIIEEVGAGVAAGEEPARLARRLRSQIKRACDTLESGLATHL